MSKYIYYEESDFEDIEQSTKEELIEELKHTYLVKLNDFMRFLEEEEIKNFKLIQRIDKAINKVQYIIDYGFDYDGFNQVDRLKCLIDMLVDYARQTKNILRGESND